jgi:hypothetical protein
MKYSPEAKAMLLGPGPLLTQKGVFAVNLRAWQEGAVLLTPPQLLMESTTAWQTPVDSTTKFPKKEITIVEA